MTISRVRWSIAVYAGVLLAGSASPSHAPAQTTQVAVESKPLSFEVVSVRENKSGAPQRIPDLGPTPVGYRAINAPLVFSVLSAYTPTTSGNSFYGLGQISGLPDWALQQPYDLTAKVSEDDLPEWGKASSQQGMLRAMLQTFFIDRCKMSVHRETKDASVYFLVPAKGGPKLKPTDPVETHVGMNVPTGGVMAPGPQGMMAYGVSTGTIAATLSMMTGGSIAIVDKTGLTGRYDVAMNMRQRAGPDSDPATMFQQQLDDLGLKIESGKAPVERLVIDHIERPSAN